MEDSLPEQFHIFRNIPQAKNRIKKSVQQNILIGFLKMSTSGVLYFVSKEKLVILMKNSIRLIQGKGTGWDGVWSLSDLIYQVTA